LETVNEFTKDRREHIESIDNEIKQVKEKITNVKQGWISYLESLFSTILMDPIDFIVSHGSLASNLKVEYFAFSVKVAIVSSISDRSVFKVWVRRNAWR
jgi:hypothetical protein